MHVHFVLVPKMRMSMLRRSPKNASQFHEGVNIKHVHFMSPFTVVQQASNGGLLHDPKFPWSAQKVQTT